LLASNTSLPKGRFFVFYIIFKKYIKMFISIITDCIDHNAKGRVETRLASFFKIQPSFVGVSSDIEASGNLVDILDAGKDHEGVIIVNVAPRKEGSQSSSNGSLFGYFYVNNMLVVATVDGYCLSLAKKLELFANLNVLNTVKVTTYAKDIGLLTKENAKHVSETQFRSYEYAPLVALWLKNGIKLPVEKSDFVPKDIYPTVWFIDNFGNCKTTLTERDVSLDKPISVNGTKYSYSKRLHCAPEGKLALITGSSGHSDNRFLEIVIKGGNAAEKAGLKVGARLKIIV
jgi:hypothetical protein